MGCQSKAGCLGRVNLVVVDVFVLPSFLHTRSLSERSDVHPAPFLHYSTCQANVQKNQAFATHEGDTGKRYSQYHSKTGCDDKRRSVEIKRPDPLLEIAPLLPYAVESPGSWVTVGEFKSAAICVSHMPSWKAKKAGKLTQEKVLREL